MPSGVYFTVHGARGSAPASGRGVVRYGGHTTCFSVDGLPDKQVIVDCGTGLAFAEALRHEAPTEYHVFLTHYHFDHLQGLQFFTPLYDEKHQFVFYGHPPEGMTVARGIQGVFTPPWFPVDIEDDVERRRYVTLDGSPVVIEDLEVSYTRLRHPQGVTAYRLDIGDRSVVVATDHEAGDAERDTRLTDVASGASALLHDAQYTPGEYETYRGWGHSTWRDACAAATAAGVERLVLTSHDPNRSDAAIDDIVRQARREFPLVEAAREGMRIAM
jgi:phosphoribosyl 1,2-cyclic phosphodiesterase